MVHTNIYCELFGGVGPDRDLTVSAIEHLELCCLRETHKIRSDDCEWMTMKRDMERRVSRGINQPDAILLSLEYIVSALLAKISLCNLPS